MKKTKTYSLLQLFSIVDGRLSTNMDDVQDMLNHITGESLMTHHLPIVIKFLDKKKPLWYIILKQEVETLKMMYNDDFKKIISVIHDDLQMTFDVPQLDQSPEAKAEFGQFMVDQSLLGGVR